MLVWLAYSTNGFPKSVDIKYYVVIRPEIISTMGKKNAPNSLPYAQFLALSRPALARRELLASARGNFTSGFRRVEDLIIIDDC